MHASIHAALTSIPESLVALALQDTPTGPPAPAQAPAGGGLLGGNFMLPMLLVLAVFWFVMIGPERKNRKKREAMLAALKKGDKVMTTSGMYGTVGQVQGNIVTLAIADGVRVRVSLQSIQAMEDEKPANEKAETAVEPQAGSAAGQAARKERS
jgi:preprotein translocase subunit YajC